MLNASNPHGEIAVATSEFTQALLRKAPRREVALRGVNVALRVSAALLDDDQHRPPRPTPQP